MGNYRHVTQRKDVWGNSTTSNSHIHFLKWSRLDFFRSENYYKVLYPGYESFAGYWKCRSVWGAQKEVHLQRATRFIPMQIKQTTYWRNCGNSGKVRMSVVLASTSLLPLWTCC